SALTGAMRSPGSVVMSVPAEPALRVLSGLAGRGVARRNASSCRPCRRRPAWSRGTRPPRGDGAQRQGGTPVTLAPHAMASFALHGIGVSRGIAIGRAQLVSHATLEVAHY